MPIAEDFRSVFQKIDDAMGSFNQEYHVFERGVSGIQQQSDREAREEELRQEQEEEEAASLAEAQRMAALDEEWRLLQASRAPYYVPEEAEAFEPSAEEGFAAGQELEQPEQTGPAQSRKGASQLRGALGQTGAQVQAATKTAKKMAGKRLLNFLWGSMGTLVGILWAWPLLNIFMIMSFFSRDPFWKAMSILQRLGILLIDALIVLILIVLFYAALYFICDSWTIQAGIAWETRSSDFWRFCSALKDTFN